MPEDLGTFSTAARLKLYNLVMLQRIIILYNLLLVASFAEATELRVLTSFPPVVSNPFVELVESTHDDLVVQVLNKNTVAAIDEVLRGNQRQFDIFWSSSPEAFELLRQHNAFAEDHLCGAAEFKSVEPFAWSSVGWARNATADVAMPREWNDLLKPMYRNSISMARPARSGTAHMVVETILQFRGWEDGWAYFLELSANLSTLTARSFGVPDGLINNRFSIGLTIDFLAQSKRELEFRYGHPIILVPALVGILKNGKENGWACEYLKAILSDEGQTLLFDPAISRIPYNARVRQVSADRIPTEMAAALNLPWLEYDSGTSSDRYWAVNTLFDLMITETLEIRRELWSRLYALETHALTEEYARTRALLSSVIITAVEASKASAVNQDGLRSTALISLGPEKRNLVRRWRQAVANQLTAADTLLSDMERNASQPNGAER